MAAFAVGYGVLRPGERVLLMLSGGADSMALLAIIRLVDRRLRLGLELAALHVDYATRGADSARDADIVGRACAAAGATLHVVRLERRLVGGDFQARARELRYREARALAEARGYDAIVTAHNRDDQAETVLYQLTKYATPRALVGMRPRDGRLARPLLCLGAGEIREYCGAASIDYGEDVTNARPVYARNRLRLEVLPLLQALNPRVVETLADAAGMAAAQEEIVAAAVAAAEERVAAPADDGDLAALDIRALRAESPALQALVLHESARRALGGEALVERRLVAALLALCARLDDAGRVSLGRGVEAVRAGGSLRLRRREPAHVCPSAAVDGAELAAAGDEGCALVWCGRSYRVRLLAPSGFDRAAAAAGQAYIGLGAPPHSVTLRHPRRGERFAPLGLGEETTVARFLAGARVPAGERARARVIEVDGAAAWIGYGGARARGRVAQSRRVNESTRCILHVFREGP
ncbi:MAG TPA: tRNA lysidine(34) synthetase TilS [Thermoleophilia bacterium]|nr:tRNA lysidine(34) synthetase TilS [Thermoleophilia bacterium]